MRMGVFVWMVGAVICVFVNVFLWMGVWMVWWMCDAMTTENREMWCYNYHHLLYFLP